MLRLIFHAYGKVIENHSKFKAAHSMIRKSSVLSLIVKFLAPVVSEGVAEGAMESASVWSFTLSFVNIFEVFNMG